MSKDSLKKEKLKILDHIDDVLKEATKLHNEKQAEINRLRTKLRAVEEEQRKITEKKEGLQND